MNEIKEKYNIFRDWLKTQDKEKIDFLYQHSYDLGNSFPELKVFRNCIEWYTSISEISDENIDYIFGDKIASIKGISKYMLNYISSFEEEVEESKKDWIKEFGSETAENSHGETFEEHFTENNHSSGYAGIEEYEDVKSFWENLDEDSIISVISGSAIDDYDVDLNGHRQYWLSRSKVEPLLFSYIYYLAKKTQEELDEELYNSNDIHDDVCLFFVPEDFRLFTSEEINELFDKVSLKKRKREEDRFNYMAKNIISEFEKNPEFSDRVGAIKKLMFEK